MTNILDLITMSGKNIRTDDTIIRRYRGIWSKLYCQWHTILLQIRVYKNTHVHVKLWKISLRPWEIGQKKKRCWLRLIVPLEDFTEEANYAKLYKKIRLNHIISGILIF